MGRLVGGLIRLAFTAWIAFFVGALAYAAARRRQAPPRPMEDSDEVALAAIFEPLEFRSTASAFRGGTVECWFGGGEIDLRRATLDPAGATLRTTFVFGGGSLIVPEEWRVDNRVVGIFGGAGDTRGGEPAPDAPTLVIEGVAIFGGLGIMSRSPRGDSAPAGHSD